VIHEGMSYDSIQGQGQGHRSLRIIILMVVKTIN